MGDHRLFHVVPISFIIDAMDCAILLVFVTFGIIEAIEVFRGSDNEQKRAGQDAGATGVEASTIGGEAEALTGGTRAFGPKSAEDGGAQQAVAPGT